MTNAPNNVLPPLPQLSCIGLWLSLNTSYRKKKKNGHVEWLAIFNYIIWLETSDVTDFCGIEPMFPPVTMFSLSHIPGLSSKVSIIVGPYECQ